MRFANKVEKADDRTVAIEKRLLALEKRVAAADERLAVATERLAASVKRIRVLESRMEDRIEERAVSYKGPNVFLMFGV